MPQIIFEKTLGIDLHQFVTIPFRYNRKDYILLPSHAGDAVVIVDTNGNVTKLSLPSLLGSGVGKHLIDANMKGSKLYARIFWGDYTNKKYRLIELEVDLSAQEANVTELWSLDSSNDADLTTGIALKDAVIPPRFIIHAEPNKSYLYYIDVKDGAIVSKWDTGFGSYNPRASFKWIAKPDDIYMLLGKHLTNSSFYVLKIYSKTISEILNSDVDGESPNPMVGHPFFSEKRYLFPASGVTVDGSSPPVRWFDDDFNLIGTTDITTIYAYAHPYGWFPIGIDSNGNLVVFAIIADNYFSSATVNTVRILKISLSDFSIVQDTVLKEYRDLNNAIVSMDEHGSDWATMAVIDKEHGYLYAPCLAKVNGEFDGMLLKIDISDLDIVEWNNYAFYIPATKIPTMLNLKVIPL